MSGQYKSPVAPCETSGVLDERLVRSLHVQTLREEELHAEREPHVLFQASTIGSLLDGAYKGDVTFAELAEHGDLGLGTLNSLDGEMIAVDGRFYRADIAGTINEVEPSTRTPFAVLTWFTPTVELEVDEPLSHEELLAKLDARLPEEAVACAVRVDGSFELVHARSVPRQEPPYRGLAEVVEDQRVFDLADVEGTMVGFRFPDYSEGIEVSGYHLHFITADRTRGGHVLGGRLRHARAQLDVSTDLHVELPPGIDLSAAATSQATHEALIKAERWG
jgi:acetolactate decarboxylase